MKRVLKAALYRAVYLAGRPLRDGGVTILSYHSIDDYGTGISVPPGLFERQMAALAAEGCPTFTMAQVEEYLGARRAFPPRAVAITFDDGFANVATVGVPIMARYGLAATVYVITGMVGRVTQWRAYGKAMPSLPVMTWEQIREAQAVGVEVGGHTVTHGFLTHCAAEGLRYELQDCKDRLEQELGGPVLSFAYPQGDYNRAVIAATRAAGYSNAVTIDQGRARLSSDPFRLRRLHVGGNTTPAVLKAFTVPAIGPTYRVVNLVVKGVLGRKTWPRPAAKDIQSTQSVAMSGQWSVVSGQYESNALGKANDHRTPDSAA